MRKRSRLTDNYHYWRHWHNIMYEAGKRVERARQSFIWHLPSWMIQGATYRLFAHATMGKYDNTIADKVTMFEAVDRWGTAVGGDRRRNAELLRRGWKPVESAEEAWARNNPETAKWHVVAHDGEAIAKFLAHCSREESMWLAKIENEQVVFPNESLETILGRYFEIDVEKMKAERRAEGEFIQHALTGE